MTPRGHSPSAERWHAVGVKRTTAALKVLEKETQRRLRELLDLRRSGQGADEAGGRPAHRRPRWARPCGTSGNDAPRATRPLATTALPKKLGSKLVPVPVRMHVLQTG
ncbi:hypothetical protein DIPPA_17814 [Diplonema papillatum]|nr:hypothetical protein DIPPA_17814 [Diplonema papillatum]